MKRRNFLKITSATFGGCALAASPGIGTMVAKGLAHDSGTVTRSPTYCEICFWKCAGWVYKKDNKPWKVIGNEADLHSAGRFCTRGTGGVGSYTDDERLKTPLIRTSARGKQIFRKSSWDEALDYVATKMKAIANKHGPESVALFNHGTGGTFFKNLLKAYGSGNIAAPSYAQCRGPREEAFWLTFGAGLGSPECTDIKNTNCLVLIGAHLGENLHNGQVQEFAQAIENNASIITVDPRFSVAAGKSKYWLPIRPSTDIALLLAWVHVLINEEIYNKEYVNQNTLGFEELKKWVSDKTPEWAYPITTIRPNIIRETAREMAKNAPATIVHPSRHVTWYGDDTQRIRAIAILNALLGSWGSKGGFYRPVKAKVPPYPIPKYPEFKTTWQDKFPQQFPFASQAIASGVCDATIPFHANKNPFKGWIVYGTNLIKSLPNPNNTVKAIQNLDLLVTIDTMPAEITGWSDVVLPECTYLERYDDIRVSQGREAQIALRAPAFKPKYDSKPGWWIAKKLANKLDLGAYFPWKHIEEYLDYRLKAVNSSLEEMKRVGVKRLGTQKASYFTKGKPIEFNTDSGKIELYSTALAEAGFDPIPKYTTHPRPPQDFYRLLYGRSPYHTFGRTTNNPILTQMMPENEVWVHPSVADYWGIKNGSMVRLENKDGVLSNHIKVRVTQRIRKDCVYLVHGFGHTQKQMMRSYLKGADDNDLMTTVMVDPIMGGTGMRGNFVTFKV